jgi:hypothetical protein
MTGRFNLPSVRTIRAALEEVPGALRDDPLPEDAGAGGEPATEIWISDPDTGSYAIDSSMASKFHSKVLVLTLVEGDVPT